MTDTTTLDALDNIARLALEAETWKQRAEAAEAELGVTRSLLTGAVDGRLMWYEDIADYLETL